MGELATHGAAYNVVGRSRAELERFVSGLGVPKYRARQIMAWVYNRGVTEFSAMTDLPAASRELLAERASIGAAEVVTRRRSRDGTVKLLLRFPDGAGVECVAMVYAGERSTCVSTQVGCRFACAFCASGQGGFTRDLTVAEMVEQVLRLGDARRLVLMGTGEPLDNYAASLGLLRFMASPDGPRLSYRRMTVSTCGLIPGIDRLAQEEIPVTLAVSLHAANDEVRDRLMPVNRRYPLRALLAAADRYAEATGRRVTYEWALIAGVNDGPEHARELAGIMRGRLSHVNLINLNPVEGYAFQPAHPARAAAFRRILEGLGVTVTTRRPLGRDVAAACGQLRRRSPAPPRR